MTRDQLQYQKMPIPKPIIQYKGHLIYYRHHCGKVFEVFVNHLSIGLSHIPLDYAKRLIDSKK